MLIYNSYELVDQQYNIYQISDKQVITHFCGCWIIQMIELSDFQKIMFIIMNTLHLDFDQNKGYLISILLISMSITQKFFAEFDMFSAPPQLRAKKEPETSSYTSGIISFILALIFSYVFIIKAYQVLVYSEISSVQTESKLNGNEAKADNIFFAIRVGYLPISTSSQYFDVGVYTLNDTQNITVKMVPCKLDMFQQIGEGTESQFHDYKLSQFLCPESKQFLDVRKVFYAPNSQYVMVYIRPCVEGPTCQNQSEQARFVNQLKQKQGAIFVLAYFLDNTIDPQSRNPVEKTLNTDIELSFTTKRGIIATIQLGTYKISTDVGFFPVQTLEQDQGNFVHSYRQTSIQIQNETTNFALIYISMNRRHILVQRKVGKFDEMLSYAGGLFSIIIGFLSFFMFSYNEYRYELLVAEGVFTQDQQGNSFSENSFHFCKYIKYVIFDWIKIIFCYEIKWQDCKLIDEAREEANCQMDVTNLFRRINSFQTALKYLMENGEKDCLSLLKPESLYAIKRNRYVLEYYSTVIKGQDAITIRQYRMAQKLLSFSIKIFQQSKVKSSKIINEDLISQTSRKIILDPIPKKHRKSRQIVNSTAIKSGFKPKVLFDLNPTKEHSYQSNNNNHSYNNNADESMEQILNNFQQIVKQAEQMELQPQMIEVQHQLCQSYFNLPKQDRQKFQENIPIKILARFYKISRQKNDKQNKTRIQTFEYY